MPDVLTLKQAVESRVPILGIDEARRQVGREVRDRVAKGEWDARKLRLRDLFESFVGPVSLLETPDGINRRVFEGSSTSDDFFALVGRVVTAAARIIPADMPELVGDQLCTVLPMTSPEEAIPGTQALDRPEPVQQREEYPEANFDEKSVRPPEPPKYGQVVTVTKEMVLYDRTGLLQMQAKTVGQSLASEREANIIAGITDTVAAQYPYWPRTNAGVYTRQAVYRTSVDPSTWYARNLTQMTNTFANFGSITTAYTSMAARTDEKGRPILATPNVILAPFALKPLVMDALRATQIKRVNTTATSSDEEHQYGPNPINQIIGGNMTGVFSQYLDSISASNWYIGDPKRTFVWLEYWPLTVEQALPSDWEMMKRDIVAGYKASFKGRLACRGDDYWLLCVPT